MSETTKRAASRRTTRPNRKSGPLLPALALADTPVFDAVYQIYVIGDVSAAMQDAARTCKIQFHISSADQPADRIYQKITDTAPELILINGDIVPLLPTISRLRFHPQTSDRPIVAALNGSFPQAVVDAMARLELTVLSHLPPDQACMYLAVRCRDSRASRWRALREFSGAMAHCLNQPIAALMASGEIIERASTNVSGDLRDALELIRRNVLAVESTVRKLDELRRYETAPYPGPGGEIIDLDKSTL